MISHANYSGLHSDLKKSEAREESQHPLHACKGMTAMSLMMCSGLKPKCSVLTSPVHDEALLRGQCV